jgi:hypothetical protein
MFQHFRNVGFISYFLSIFFLNVATIFKNVGQYFFSFLDFFQHFSEMLQHFYEMMVSSTIFSTYCEIVGAETSLDTN